jgi:hypothetical protein
MADKATIVILQGHLEAIDWPELAADWQRVCAARDTFAQWSEDSATPRVRPIEHWLCQQLGWRATALEGLQLWSEDLAECAADLVEVLLTPCHFDVRLNHVGLSGLGDTPLGAAQAHSLCESLQEGVGEWSHWLGGPLRIRYAAPMYWVAELPEAADLEGCSLALAEGLNVEHYLPQGQQARVWRRILNEIQMLWHDHPVNRQRQALRQMPVNALWFGGRLAPRRPDGITDGSVACTGGRLGAGRVVMRAQDPMLKGLERYLEAIRRHRPQPAGAGDPPRKIQPQGDALRRGTEEVSCELVVMAFEPAALGVQTVARSLSEALRVAEACANARQTCDLVLLSDTAWIHLVERPRNPLARLGALGMRMLGRR